MDEISGRDSEAFADLWARRAELHDLARVLDGDALRVYFMMMTLCDEKGLFSASIDALASSMAPPMKRRTYERHHHELIRRGRLEKVQRTGRADTYRLLMPGAQRPAERAEGAPNNAPSAASDPNKKGGEPPTAKVREYMICQDRRIRHAESGATDPPESDEMRRKRRIRSADDGAPDTTKVMPDTPISAHQTRKFPAPNSGNSLPSSQNNGAHAAAAASGIGNSRRAGETDRHTNNGSSGGEEAAAAAAADLLGVGTAQAGVDFLITRTLRDPVTKAQTGPRLDMVGEVAETFDLARITRNYERAAASGKGWGVFRAMVFGDEAGQAQALKRAAADRFKSATPRRGAATITTADELEAQTTAQRARVAALSDSEVNRLCAVVLSSSSAFMADRLAKRRAEARTCVTWIGALCKAMDHHTKEATDAPSNDKDRHAPIRNAR